MRYRKEIIAPMSPLEAGNRATYVLGKWRYRNWSTPEGTRFERGFLFSGLMVIHPHQVHSRIDMSITDLENGTCKVELDQEVYKYGQPCSNLDKMVWEGDLDDVEASLTRREDPRIDRVKQNGFAGMVSIKYICLIVIPLMAVGGWLLFTGNMVAAVVSLVLIVASAVVLPILPFRMKEFPLENQLPPQSFASNYPRSGDGR